MVAVIFVWYKVFYWMRLFTNTAFFINLLTKTLKGIIPFTVMLLILLMMFSNVLFILNSVNQDLDDAGEMAQQPIFTNELD